jgi:hypothetical protein
MPESLPLDISAEEIERRLSTLGRLYELGRALREVRWLDARPPDRVREVPDPDPELEPGCGL